MQKLLSSHQRIGISDEMINVIFNRDFQTENQKNIIKMINMYRDHNNLIIACIPNFTVLDNQIKNLCKMRIDVVRRGIGIIQTPNKIIYGRDKWDTATNEKIEREWLVKGVKNPSYARLTTVRGILRFKPLREKDEKLYQRVKDEKRNIILKEEMGMKGNTNDDSFSQLMDMITNKAVRSGETLKGYALSNGITEDKLKRRIKRELVKKNLNPEISSYFYEKKLKEIKKGIF
jgi:hypothetical protein